jgi:uncharacterized protein YfaT (DUF1175 family)
VSTRRRLLLAACGATVAGSAFARPGGDGADAALRARIVDVAAAQVARLDPAWHEDQRDCAGLLRFSYRAALKALRPARLATPLFRNARGEGVDFADAATLVSFNLRARGRGIDARRALRDGDVLAFRHERLDDPSVDGAVWHLMLAAVPRSGDARVIYHPGERGAAVRHGLLRELERDAPHSWRPHVDNPSFLGFFCFAELA